MFMPFLRFFVCGSNIKLMQVIACLDVRTNDEGDLVVTKGDQYDVREHTKENEVSYNLSPCPYGRGIWFIPLSVTADT